MVAQVGMDAYQGYDADYGAHHDDASFTNAGDPSHIQQDQVEFGEDDWLVSVIIIHFSLFVPSGKNKLVT